MDDLLAKFYKLEASEEEEWELYYLFQSGKYNPAYIPDAELFMENFLMELETGRECPFPELTLRNTRTALQTIRSVKWRLIRYLFTHVVLILTLVAACIFSLVK